MPNVGQFSLWVGLQPDKAFAPKIRKACRAEARPTKGSAASSFVRFVFLW